MLPGNGDSCVKNFTPAGVSSVRKSSHVTGVAFSYDGKEIAANYSGSNVYLFDVDATISNENLDYAFESSNPTYSHTYFGHSNIRTVKEINFFGRRSEYVVSGSDDGRIFIWY